jgi:hypothetical protein
MRYAQKLGATLMERWSPRQQNMPKLGIMVALIVLSLFFQVSPCDAFVSERAPALGTAWTPAAAALALWMDYRNGLLSLEATESPLEELLQEFSRQSGVVFHLRIPAQRKVSASFRALRLEQALYHIIGGDANFVLVYPTDRPRGSSPGLPSEVWIFAGNHRGITETSETRDADREADPPALGNAEDGEDPADALVRRFEGNPGAARESARWHPDPKVRRVAITYLGEQATTEALNTLYFLLEDGESWVRGSALEALGPLVRHHRLVRENVARILEKAEHDDTRQLIADSLGVSPETAQPNELTAPDAVDDATE